MDIVDLVLGDLNDIGSHWQQDHSHNRGGYVDICKSMTLSNVSIEDFPS